MTCSHVLQGWALRSDRTITVSPVVEGEIRAEFGRTSVLSTVPNAVDTMGATLVDRSVGEGPLRAIWVGTSPYKKGLPIAIEACEIARARGLDVSLTIVGLDGHNRPTPDWQHWLGFQHPDDVAKLWATHDVFLFPTRYEACSMAVLESMAGGVPVLGSAILGWQVADGGRIIEVQAPAAYADALLQISDSGELRQLSTAAIRRAQFFSVQRMVDGYLGVLEDLVSTAG